MYKFASYRASALQQRVRVGRRAARAARARRRRQQRVRHRRQRALAGALPAPQAGGEVSVHFFIFFFSFLVVNIQNIYSYYLLSIWMLIVFIIYY